MIEERLISVIQNQSGFLFFLLPVVPKRMLFRLHKAAVAVDGTGVQGRLKLSELIVRKRDVGAPRFSRIRSRFLEPGIGTTLGYL